MTRKSIATNASSESYPSSESTVAAAMSLRQSTAAAACTVSSNASSPVAIGPLSMRSTLVGRLRTVRFGGKWDDTSPPRRFSKRSWQRRSSRPCPARTGWIVRYCITCSAFVWLFAIMLVAARPFRFLIDNVLGAALCVVTGLMCIHAANASFAAMVSLSDLLDALLYTAGVSVVASTCHWLLETCVLKRRVNPFVALLEQEMTDVVTKSCETLEEEAGPTTRLPTLHPPPLCPTSSSPRRRQHSGGDASSNSAGSSLPPALKLSLTSSSSLERSGNSSASASTMRPPLASRGGAAPGGGAVAASASLSTYAFIFAEPSSPTARGRGGPPPPPPSPPVAAAAPSASAVTMDWGDDDEEAPRTIAPFTATMSTTMRTTPTEATLSLAAIMAEDNDDGVPRTISEPTMTFVFVEDTGASDEGDAFRTPTSTTTTVQTAREEKG